MRGPIKWMAENHVASNLLMLLFIVGGIIMGSNIKQEVFPEITMDAVRITVMYPGASPAEVEEGILLKIEEQISGIAGIKDITSGALEGYGTVVAELMTGENVDNITQDIKSEIDRITTFPEDAEKPVVSKVIRKREVISIVVYGDMSEHALHERAESIRDELLENPEITQTAISGLRPYEISIEVPERNLRRHGITLGYIANRIRQASVDLPAGSLKSDDGGEILIRTKERKYTANDYASLTVFDRPDGTSVTIGDIAKVKDTFQDTEISAMFNNKPAAMIKVYRVGKQKPIDVATIVKEFAIEKEADLPPSIRLATWNDRSEIYRDRLNLLMRNAMLGLILVFIILGLFLQVRLSLFVMLGIPISFLGAMLLMPYGDISINMISLFAFILALGIVVDDAIVVGENIYKHRTTDKSFAEAAVNGAVEISTPVVFSVLTTVAAFMPLLFVAGSMGKFMRNIPVVVITILLISLVESLYILPSHLSIGKPGKRFRIDALSDWFGGKLSAFVMGPYTWVLQKTMRYRYVTIATGVAVLMISLGLAGGGILKFRFMPKVEGDTVAATVVMPVGTSSARTAQLQELIVEKGYEVIAEFDAQLPEGQSILRNIYSTIGTRLGLGGAHRGEQSGPNISSTGIFLVPSAERDIASKEVSARWRQKVGEIPGAESLTFTSSLMSFGANIDVQFSHEDFGVLEEAAQRLKHELGEYPGVYDISDSYSAGKRELKLSLKPEGKAMGITAEQLGRQVRAGLYGSTALKIQRGRNEVKVMVRYPKDERKSIEDLKNMRIRTATGGEIPFVQAAHFSEGRGYSEITRINRKRVVNVTANVNNKIANAEEILATLSADYLERLKDDYPGLNINLEGESARRAESLDSMKTGFILAMFVIYSLLAVPFRSFSQPIIIMASIPFGIVGAIAGHLLLGFDLSILSIFGIVALAGVVVNNSLLLIDYMNRQRAKGTSLYNSVLEAGQRRFRPILLTSLTTFFGLTPIIFEQSLQAQFLIPMAISLGYGVLFSTGITLVLVPSLYMALEDIKNVFRSEQRKIDTAREAA